MIRATVALTVLVLTGLGTVFGGPLRSGALLLLLPSPARATSPAQPYLPRHQGGIDLSTGLYIRRNEDLVVPGTPLLVLRRTYLSRFHESRAFGVGATHDGEWYLYGDGQRFAWAQLIHADGRRISFGRVTPGEGFWTAAYESHGEVDEWRNASLGWVGLGWALRRADGTLFMFQPCGHGEARVCSIVWSRGPEGDISYARDSEGRLTRMEAEGRRWITFDYDDRGRVVRASASTGAHVRYTYDPQGRLIDAVSSTGERRHYEYTDRDELRSIDEPDVAIENAYDEGSRCVKQVTRFAGETAPLVYTFDYAHDGRRITETGLRREDGRWRRITWNVNGKEMSEVWGGPDRPGGTFIYHRDPVTDAVEAIAVSCPGRRGQLLEHSSYVRDGNVEWVKADLLRTHCATTEWRRANPR